MFSTSPPEVRVRVEREGAPEHCFTKPFQVGRGEECHVHIASGLASRVHIGISFCDGAWWARDVDSTNGTYRGGERVERLRLEGCERLQIGEAGPVVQVAVAPATLEAPAEPKAPAEPEATTPGEGLSGKAPGLATGTAEADRVASALRSAPGTGVSIDLAQVEASTGMMIPHTKAPGSGSQNREKQRPDASPPSGPVTGPVAGSVTGYIERYLEKGSAPAGEHTQMMRKAYARVKKQEQAKYTWIIAGALLLCAAVGAYALVQRRQNGRLEGLANEVSYQARKQDVQIARLRQVVEETGNATLSAQLAGLEERREEQAQQYEGYVSELGLRRALTEEEKLIYRAARIFNESEFEIPAGFVRNVRQEINDYWLTPAGRQRFKRGVRRAEERGYTAVIVREMRKHGLPPEFFYLALQESDFDAEAVGPPTRWGIAKGMWQFIPSTGRRYDLAIGPRANVATFDPQDDRHDFRKATAAAARYLQEIYSELAQASGLLAMASYNWGEHRVVGKLEDLFEGIPADPSDRNYWRFLTAYEDRMPEQTKDYVLKIFAAAVIGQNPRHFGIDMDNPIRKHLGPQDAMPGQEGRPEGNAPGDATSRDATPRDAAPGENVPAEESPPDLLNPNGS